MWWHGGAGLTERSERGSLSAVATHDLFEIIYVRREKRRLEYTHSNQSKN